MEAAYVSEINTVGVTRPRTLRGATLALGLATLVALATGARAGAQSTTRVACTQSALTSAISQANGAGGGTILFNCSNTTIPFTTGLGSLENNVIIDGENRNITIEYTASLSGCVTGDGGGAGGGHEIGEMNGSGNVLRNLTFKNFMESFQIKGRNNTVEGNTFLGHNCSDDALSTIEAGAQNFVVRNNVFDNYHDKAIQSSYGSGLFEGNTFRNTTQPLRGPYVNSAGGVMTIRGNTFTADSTSRCDGVRYDGTYNIIFENNTHSNCLRGARFAGSTQVIVRNNTFDGNDRAGLQLYGSARATVAGNTFRNNSGGGVWIYESAQADLGGGSMSIHGQTLSSSGGNTLKGNGSADLRNDTSTLVKAEHNCWDNSTVAEITSRDTTGPVDVDPFATSCAGGGSTPPAPRPPANVRIVR
jgi:parallel beta-helix repeat protein